MKVITKAAIQYVDDILGARANAEFEEGLKARRQVTRITERLDDFEKELLLKAMKAVNDDSACMEEAMAEFKASIEKHRANKEELLAS